MKTKNYLYLLFLITGFLLPACSTVQITGRKQLNIIPNSQMIGMSFQQYDEFLKTHPLSNDKEATAMVVRVGEKISRAVGEYFKKEGISEKLKGYDWAFNLVESPEVNAWCMPGGKVVVYTGLLPVAKTETGLAVVMGHEIAHAIAQHGNERMSQQLVAQMGGLVLSEAVKEKPAETQQLWMTAFGVGAQYGILLPYSRLQESEADHLGLIFMTMAGYDPNKAVDFWQRMSAMKQGQSVPELLSTHPSDQARIDNIKKLIPEVLKYKQ